MMIVLLFSTIACSDDANIMPEDDLPSEQDMTTGFIELEPIVNEEFPVNPRGRSTSNYISGTLQFEVVTETYSAASIHTNKTAKVSAGYVLVGGGAYINQWQDKGALLTASFPAADKETWFASSKDHLYGDAHQLTVYAIGMKIDGISEATLKSYIYRGVSSYSSSSAYPTRQISLPSGYELLSGGSEISWTNPGNLLVNSHPIGVSTWYSGGKDHVSSSPAQIKSYILGIKRDIPNYGTLDTNIYQANALSGGTLSVGISLGNTGYVLTGVGGSAMQGEISGCGCWGRMLYGLRPSTNGLGATVYTKDHVYQDIPSKVQRTYVYAIGIKKL